MQFGLEGKVALVTAASKGLGRASAAGLAREGCHLVICSRNEAEINAVADEIRAETGRRVVALAADVSKGHDVDRVLATAKESFGGVDILVSNTGGPPPGMFLDFDDSAWQAAFDNLLMSAVRLSRGVIPTMKERGWGRLIYITSGSVKQPIPALVLSNAFRAAITGMMKTISLQHARDGITANCVAPGRIDTERVRFLDADAARRSGKELDAIKADFASKIPAGRYGTAEEFGNAVVFLASQAASYMNGGTVVVDGGHINTLL